MLRTHRKPGWWMLYALVPLMGGLLLLEHHVPLSRREHQYVQVGIVLFIYGLVWLCFHAQALAYDEQDRQSWEDTDMANSAVLRSLEASLAPRYAEIRDLKVRHTKVHIRAKTNGREIRKCSHSFGRLSPR